MTPAEKKLRDLRHERDGVLEDLDAIYTRLDDLNREIASQLNVVTTEKIQNSLKESGK